jgi:hypothetical protein
MTDYPCRQHTGFSAGAEPSTIMDKLREQKNRYGHLFNFLVVDVLPLAKLPGIDSDRPAKTKVEPQGNVSHVPPSCQSK